MGLGAGIIEMILIEKIIACEVQFKT